MNQAKLKKLLKNIPKDILIAYIAQKIFFEKEEYVALECGSLYYQHNSEVLLQKMKDNVNKSRRLASELEELEEKGDKANLFQKRLEILKCHSEYQKLMEKFDQLDKKHDKLCG